MGTLNALTGRVVSKTWSKVGTKHMAAFYQLVRQDYPDARRIWLIQDNWPLHFHPDVLLALEEQELLYPVKLPRNWTKVPTQEAMKQCGQWHLPIQIVQLPTYASWCNPIEKLWRKLKQDQLHLHPWANDLPTLRQVSCQRSLQTALCNTSMGLTLWRCQCMPAPLSWPITPIGQ